MSAIKSLQEQLQLQHDEGRKFNDNTWTMDESLKNQVIDTVEYTYLMEFKNMNTGFLRVTFRDHLKHLLNRYRNITTADLEDNNQQMNKPIDSSLSIDKYFYIMDEYIQFDENGNTPYTAEQVIQKAHRAVFASGVYVDACK